MELAYVCEWEKRPKCTHCPSIPLVCSWSCRNLVAFTTDLKNDDEDKGKWQHRVAHFSCFRLHSHQCWLFDTTCSPLACDTTLMCHIHVAQQCHLNRLFVSLSEVSHMIHIIDTEHPWDVYCISSGHTEVISCLEWDQSGKPLLLLLLACLLLCTFLSFTCFLGFFCLCAGSRLLSADGDGQIKCWSMSDHLVNSWENILLSSVDGDPIVALTWLHNGVKLALHVEMVMLQLTRGR